MLYADDISTAKELFDEKKDYKEALRIFETFKSAPEADYYLGKAYHYGLGVEKDNKKTFEYAQKSASAKFPAGINLLGVLYQYGKGVEKDETKAFLLYNEAANLGNPYAMANLGRCYFDDKIIKHDNEKATFWLHKAINAGNNLGYLYLGGMYYLDGRDKEALELHLKYEEIEPEKITPDFYMMTGSIYLSLKNYDLAYSYILKASEKGQYDSSWNLYDLVRNKHVSSNKKEEALYWLKKASDPSINKTDSLKFTRELLYTYYLYDSNQSDKAIQLAISDYQNGDLRMGCYLVTQYGNILDNAFNLEKSYTIATKIISENKPSNDLAPCFFLLAGMYKTGHYVAKDPKKSIELEENIFNDIYNRKNDLYSKWIAEAYMKDLHDYENAQKWFQITYDLTKDATYLTKVDEYKKTLLTFTDSSPKKEEQNVFPIIDNFSKKEQIISVLESNQYYFLAIDQKSVNVYDKKTLSFIKELRGWIGTGIAGMTLRMAFDENKKILYCTGINSGQDGTKNETIRAFDINSGKIVKTILNTNSMKTLYLNISSDGRYLIAINQPQRLQIINIETNAIQTYNYSNIANFTEVNIEKIGNDYVVNALANDDNLYKFSVNLKRQISKERFSNQTIFKKFNFQHAQYILPNQKTNNIRNIKIENQTLHISTQDVSEISNFDLKSLILSSQNKSVNFNKNSSTAIHINQKNDSHTLDVYRNSIKLSTIELLAVNALSYEIINDKYVVVTTSDIDTLYVFNLQGRAIASLKGVQSLQKNLLYQDEYLISYGDDNIIHIWDLDYLDKIDQLKEVYDQTIVNSAYKQLGVNILVATDINSFDEDFDKQSEFMMQSMSLNFKPTKEQIVFFFKMILSKKEEIYPLASLYINNNEWLMFEPNGFFASSQNGKNLIKYHQNQGFDKEAKVIDNTQIFEKFYRPDLIKKKLAKQTIQVDVDIKSVIQSINPPLVEILTNKFVDSKNLDITYKVCDSGSGVSNTTLIVNGIGATPNFTRGFSIEKNLKAHEACQLYKNTITLRNGLNIIAIKSFDANQTMSSTSKEVTVNAQYSANDQANLYFVSIAVADYKNATLNLKFPVNDVVAVKNKIEQKSKTLFKNMFSYQLHDHEMTATNFDRLFTDLSKKINTNDVLIVYIAGHGTTSDKDGLYYFYPHDISDTTPNELKKQAISVNNIKYQLSKIQAQKSLILFDTCNSGSVLDSLDQKIIGDRLSQDNSRNFIVASSKRQVALEGHKNHGVFTYAVLEAFDKAYFGNQTKLTPTTLAGYVENEVPAITLQYFQYEQTPQKYLSGEPFDIGTK